MTELINSLKTFASSSSSLATSSIGNPFSSYHQPLMTLQRADSCTESGFNQWRDAMRMVARLPGGLPTEFRLRLWENLADRYLQRHGIDWSRVASKCHIVNPRDQEIADQIEKDLHRTGCTGFSGAAKQAVLKHVLIAYSKWNPSVGYCQGFNMIGAMLLQMTNGNEKLTLKIFIFLIEGVLPEGYFGQGLRGLAVDMAVFREILKLRKPTLNAHLNRLQKKDNSPPLPDVFTMHWFLTLFIHCLPNQTVLRIWDLVLLEGSEILLRTSLVLWAAIETRILCVSNTDEFYSVMGVVTREMLEFGLMDPNSLMKCVVSVGPFPFPGLEEMRQRHRALISQETPCKSFFLAKKELDTLKRHYAAIRHRQRATTIIFKGLDSHPKNQRLVVPTKRQTACISPKPKLRRQCSTKNNNNSSSSLIVNKNFNSPSSGKNATNSINHNKINCTTRTKQITVSWDKSLTNKFRKRRSSASSHTSTSSSTELCDTSSENEDDESTKAAWVDTVKEKVDLKPTSISDDEKIATNHIQPISSYLEPKLIPQNGSNNTETEVCDGLLTETKLETDGDPCLVADTSESSEYSKIIDTNDSQHFLEEMSRLGKSDSFYENLSQRICELQFHNLTLLTTCNNVLDKENSLSIEPDYTIMSPLPSPISPIQPYYEHQDYSKLSLTPYLTHLSPRGSISSNGESPLPRSPLSPSPDPNYGNLLTSPRKNSKSSVSSVELNESKPDVIDLLNEKSESQPNPETLLNNSEFIPLKTENESSVPLTEIEFNETIENSDSKSYNETESVKIGIKLGTNDILNENAPMNFEVKNESNSVADLSLEPGSSKNLSSRISFENVNNSNEMGQTSEEDINAVIRENLAILQRLKLKPAYEDDTGDDYDYYDYYTTDSSDNDEAFSTTGKGPDSNSLASKPTKIRSRSNSSGSKSGLKSVKPHKPKKQFNPFPTTRKPRLKTTKFGLYS